MVEAGEEANVCNAKDFKTPAKTASPTRAQSSGSPRRWVSPMLTSVARPVRRHQINPGPGQYSLKSDFSGRVVKPTDAGQVRGFTWGSGSKEYCISRAIADSCTPGPVYLLRGSMSKQNSSRSISAPSFGFGTAAQREPVVTAARKAVPGPGEYRSAKSTGQQSLSTRRSEPTAKFGTRQQLGGPSNGIKAYTGKEFERENLGLVGPGPGRYDVGRKVKDNAGDFESALDSTPKYSFAGGSYSREAEDALRENLKQRKVQVPGPGAYNQHSSSMAQQFQGKPSAQTNPSWRFGSAQQRATAADTKAKNVMLSHEHVRKENLGVHSPPSTRYTPGTRTAQGDTFLCGPKATFGTNPRFRDLSLPHSNLPG